MYAPEAFVDEVWPLPWIVGQPSPEEPVLDIETIRVDGHDVASLSCSHLGFTNRQTLVPNGLWIEDLSRWWVRPTPENIAMLVKRYSVLSITYELSRFLWATYRISLSRVMVDFIRLIPYASSRSLVDRSIRLREWGSVGLYYFIEYCPSSFGRKQDEWSKKLVALKQNVDDAVMQFANLLSSRVVLEGVSIAVVPSSTVSKVNACTRIVRALGHAGFVYDCSDVLVRVRNSPHGIRGGWDDSVEIINVHKILGKHVVLFDDVYTSGGTMRRFSRVLLNAGAEQVTQLALGLTT